MLWYEATSFFDRFLPSNNRLTLTVKRRGPLSFWLYDRTVRVNIVVVKTSFCIRLQLFGRVIFCYVPTAHLLHTVSTRRLGYQFLRRRKGCPCGILGSTDEPISNSLTNSRAKHATILNSHTRREATHHNALALVTDAGEATFTTMYAPTHRLGLIVFRARITRSYPLNLLTDENRVGG